VTAAGQGEQEEALVAGVQLPAMPAWPDLPADVQRHVLLCEALSLQDLAKVAGVNKLFLRAYEGRCAIEDQWLERVANTVFGGGAIGKLLLWFKGPKKRLPWSEEGTAHEDFQVPEGGEWPSVQTLLDLDSAKVSQAAHPMLGGQHLLEVSWSLFSLTRGSVILRGTDKDGTEYRLMTIQGHGREVHCRISPVRAANCLPCVALAYLFCRMMGSSRRNLRRWATLPVAARRSLPIQVSLNRGAGIPCSWNAMPGVSHDTQRALHALHRQTWMCAPDRPVFFLHWYWCDAPPPALLPQLLLSPGPGIFSVIHWMSNIILKS
jgi:hypothetical protein